MSGLYRVSKHAILIDESERLANVDSPPDGWVRRKFFQRGEFIETQVSRSAVEMRYLTRRSKSN
ncbi:MAG: hypothetical protein VYC71_03150 [Planctomycetota bacterium]|nr:hypothetical protein [Planctomycetota bacterium]